MRVKMATDVLQSLRHYDLIAALVKSYCSTCHTGYVAESINCSE
jgi:hypothetical protein